MVASLALTVAGVMSAVVARPGGPEWGALPQQRVWGTPVVRPAVVPARQVIGGVSDGRLVFGTQAGQPTEIGPIAGGHGSARPKGAVPAALSPGRPASRELHLPALRLLRAPAQPPLAGFRQSLSRPLPGLDAANRTEYANPDGSRTVVFSAGPVNYRLPDGAWARIDTTLVPAGSALADGPSSADSASAGWRVAASGVPEWFAPSAGAAALVRVGLRTGGWASFSLAGAANVRGVVSGDSVTYAGVFPGADVRYIATATGVTENLVLRSRGAPVRWVFPLSLPKGVRAAAATGGMIDLVSASGVVLATIPHGYMTDSAINQHSGMGAYSNRVSYRLYGRVGRQVLVMTLDARWLGSPARVFPVTADPSVSPENANGTTYVQTNDIGDHSGEFETHAGTYDSGSDEARSLIDFSGVASALQNDLILGAYLNLFETWAWSCHPRPVYVYPVTSSWTPSGAQSWPGPSIGKPIGRASFALGWVQLGQTTSPCPANWRQIPLDQGGTSLINGWAHGSPDYGLAVGASGKDNYGWKKFGSKNETNGDPFLTVTYVPNAAKYKLADTRPVTQVTSSQDGKLKVTVTNTGSTTWTPTNGYEMSYKAFNSRGAVVANHPVFTAMPSTVAPGQSVTVDVIIKAMPVGSYTLDLQMYSGAPSNPAPFAYVPPMAIGLIVADPFPVVKYVYPPNGFVSSTVNPQLGAAAYVPSGKGTVTYQFAVTCNPLPGTTCPTNVFGSAAQTKPYWTVTQPLAWNEPYTWTVIINDDGSATEYGPVSLTPEVPQPVVTSRLGAGAGGAAGGAIDPGSGNYLTSAQDASVAVPGPPLDIARTYNSADPRLTGAFGAGWSSAVDMKVTPDSAASNSDALVTMADGQQVRFGYSSTNSNKTVSYVAPEGSRDALQKNSDGTWTLHAPSGMTYNFGSSGVISQLTNAEGLAQVFASAGGQVSTITDSASGRSLSLTWSTPPGAQAAHVSTVTINPAVSGQSGTWTYSYSGDKLAQACSPSGCVSYADGQSVSHYNASVLDPGPRAFYPFNDPAGSTTAEEQVAANLGQTDGSYTSVTSGGAGPIAGSSATSASFNGTSSYATLAPNLVMDSTYLSVGLWFKAAAGKSGVLFAYQASPMSASTSGERTPALYIGTDGKLRGEFWQGQTNPITTGGTVTNGNWHYVVVTGAGNTQTLYLDGAVVGTLSGTIDQLSQTVDVAGAGFWNGWPAVTSNAKGFFTGSLADVAVYPLVLTAGTVAEQYKLAGTASPELTQVTLPVPDLLDPAPISAQVTYDASADRVSSYVDANGGEWDLSSPSTTGLKATSEALGQAITSVTLSDPAGYNEVYAYDDLNGGRLISYDRGAGTGARLDTYDSAGFLASVTDEDGNSVSFSNDVFGNVLSRSWSDVTGCPPNGVCTTNYSYYENLSNPVDPRNGALTGVRDARSSGPTDNTYLTSYAYNAAGELTSSTTPPVPGHPSGLTTSYAYATAGGTPATGGGSVPAGMLLSVTSPGGAVTSYAYFSDGDLAQVTSPLGLRTAYTYDGQGRAATQTVTSDTYPAGLVTSYTWNAVNQPATITYPAVANPVTSTTHQLVDTWSYDGDGQPVGLIQSDATGGDASRTWTWTYDDYERLATVDDSAGGTSAYNYDGSGNVITMTNADGTEHDYTYNAWNEMASDTMQTPSGPQVMYSYSYDPAGLLAAVTDPMGRITNYAYDPGQELIGITATDSVSNTGRDVLYTYDNAGNVASMSTNGLVGGLVKTTSLTTYSTDAAGRTSQMAVDPQGLNRSTSYAYTPDSQVATKTVADGAGSTVTSYGYDAAGDTTSQSVADGSAGNLTTTWTYDERGLPLTMVSPDGNVSGGTPANYTTNYNYDATGNLAAVTSPPTTVRTYTAQAPTVTQPVTTYGHDTYGDVTQVMDPDRNVTAKTYNGDGQVTSVTQPAYTQPGGTSPIPGTTSYTYDSMGNVTSMTDPAQNTTSYAYDQLGDLITRTDPQVSGQSAPGTWSYAYDADREMLSAQDPTGSVTTSTWDYFGDRATSTQQVRSASGTINNTTNYSYDYLGDPVQVTSPDGVKVTATYDPAAELTSKADAYGNTTSYEYNRLGEPTQVTNPDQTSSQSAYDPDGRLTGTSQWSAPPPAPQTATQLASQSYGYDASGNMTSRTDSNNHMTTSAYNPAGQVTSQVTPVTSTTSITIGYGYDAAGNQTAYTDGNGNTTWTTYNSRGLSESVIEPPTTAYPNPADGTWTTSYDADKNPVTQTEPGGVTVTSTYDQLGRLTGQSGTGADASTATRTFGYDLAGQLTSAGTPAGTDTFGYDDAGNILSAAGPSGASSFTWNGDNQVTSATTPAGTTSYTYDNAGRLATLANPAPAATMTYGYNPDSQVSNISYGSGNDTRAFGYDGLHRLTTDTLATSTGQTVASQAYGYDPNGNLTSKTTTGLTGAGTTAYTYDQANRLASATTGGTTTNYGWDNAGNLTQDGAITLTYDARDEVTTTQLGSAAPNTNTYTARGTLAATASGFGNFPYTTDAYGQPATQGVQADSYDALGRLVTDTGYVNTHNLTYSGASDLITSDGTNTYTYDPSGTLTAVGTQGTPGQGQLALTDSHTDLTGLFAPAATTMTASESYDPIGNPATTGTMPAIGYQSDFTDAANSFVHMGARWYWPGYSTFTTNDTIDNAPAPVAVSTNAHNYADSNPLTGTDPSGHYPDPHQPTFSFTTNPCLAYIWSMLGCDVGGILSSILLYGGWQQAELMPYTTPAPPSPSSSSNGDGGGGGWCTACVVVGVGVTAYCLLYPEACFPPVFLPPPPPPPQDIYTHGAAAKPAPRAFKHDPRITNPRQGDSEDPWRHPNMHRIIDESKLDQDAARGGGHHPASAGNDASPTNSDTLGNTSGDGTQPVSDINKPPNPSADPPRTPSARFTEWLKSPLHGGVVGGGLNGTNTFVGCELHGNSFEVCAAQGAVGFGTGFAAGALANPEWSGWLKWVGTPAIMGGSALATNATGQVLTGKGSFWSRIKGINPKTAGAEFGIGAITAPLAFFGNALVGTGLSEVPGVGTAVCDPGNFFLRQSICPGH